MMLAAEAILLQRHLDGPGIDLIGCPVLSSSLADPESFGISSAEATGFIISVGKRSNGISTDRFVISSSVYGFGIAAMRLAMHSDDVAKYSAGTLKGIWFSMLASVLPISSNSICAVVLFFIAMV